MFRLQSPDREDFIALIPLNDGCCFSFFFFRERIRKENFEKTQRKKKTTVKRSNLLRDNTNMLTDNNTNTQLPMHWKLHPSKPSTGICPHRSAVLKTPAVLITKCSSLPPSPPSPPPLSPLISIFQINLRDFCSSGAPGGIIGLSFAG